MLSENFSTLLEENNVATTDDLSNVVTVDSLSAELAEEGVLTGESTVSATQVELDTDDLFTDSDGAIHFPMSSGSSKQRSYSFIVNPASLSSIWVCNDSTNQIQVYIADGGDTSSTLTTGYTHYSVPAQSCSSNTITVSRITEYRVYCTYTNMFIFPRAITDSF